MSSVQLFASPDVVIRAEADVGEGPVLDHRTGRLCWVDITAGRLIESDLTAGEHISTTLPMSLGAAAPRALRNGFAVAVADGFGLVVDGRLEVLDPVLPEPHRRMNDAKCDSSGRLWAGSTHLDFTPGRGALHCWTGTEESHVAATGLTLPNGLGWSPDDSTMYLADSMTRRLLRAAFDADDGHVSEFSELLATDGSGLPDGLAVDVDGCLWLAMWGAAEVRRISPVGELIGRIPMPVDQPSSCAFGEDGTLYITSASAGLDADDRARQPLAGSVFAIDSGTRGVPVRAFAA